ncbi:MAG TPA: PilZ domain-containing protein [Candidatus Sulfotelmatobacter sp.]
MCAQPGRAFLNTPGRRLRRNARYRASFQVLVTLLAAGRYQTLEAHCKDVSKAGLGLMIAAEIASGEVVSLNFTLPGLSEPWEVRGVLRHRRGYHYGFEFLSLCPDRNTILKQFIQGLERADFDQESAVPGTAERRPHGR